MSLLQQKITLPNGAIISNRIAKSAMSENLGTKNYAPSAILIKAYEKWAKGNAGLLITGNIMIDSKALGEPMNVVIENEDHLYLLTKWAKTVKGANTQLWAQLNHPGRQAMELINVDLKAPSAVPLKNVSRKNATSKIPKELTEVEILAIIEAFGRTSKILKKAGFAGVQIHGAHGYLVSQFLSPLSNIRTDKWGGNIENRARFVLEVYRSIRAKVGSEFSIGIKLNSADFQKGGFTEEESMEVVKLLSEAGIDLIEISGGTYESPVMMGKGKKSTLNREAYFMDYIEKARMVTTTPLMLTGGFRTPKLMTVAIASNQVDIIGIARPFGLYPNLATDIFEGRQDSFPVNIPKSGIKMIDNTMNIIWFEAQINRLGKGKEPNFKLNPIGVFLSYAAVLLKRKLFG